MRCMAAGPGLLSTMEQLRLLRGPLQALLLPRLRLADVRAFGQTCAVGRACIRSLPDALLWQLAEVGPVCSGCTKACVHQGNRWAVC